MIRHSRTHGTVTTSGRPVRRGVLLLVVLSMLTLFLMLGTAYLVTASRARQAARAYARLTFGGDEARIPHGRIADMVLLKVLRGGTTPPVGPGATFESLLADKYGMDTRFANVEVTAPAASATVPPPVLTLSATLVSGTVSGTIVTSNSAMPTDLNGRLLTLAIPGRPATTHRILRARLQGSSSNTNAPGSEFTLSVDMPRRPGPWTGVMGGRAIINGREFGGAPSASPLTNPANEGWDGFDDHNPFLARVTPGATIASSSVARVSYFPALTGTALTAALTAATNLIPDGADNDNDGVPDGLFMDFGIPPATDAFGNQVEIHASVLVVDLDGRFNVNAHGSLTPLIYSGTHPGWTQHTQVSGSFTDVPLGSGYGPADIAANRGAGNDPRSPESVRTASPRLFDSESIKDSGNARESENPKVMLITGGRSLGNKGPGVPRQRGTRPAQSRYQADAPTPQLQALEGRFGGRSPQDIGWLSGSNTLGQTTGFPWARPGVALADDVASRINDRRAPSTASDTVNYGVPRVWWTGTTFNWGTNAASYPAPRGVYNSPPDLHGRMKTFTLAASGTGIVPQLAFVQPEWSSGIAANQQRESTDDPYELRLDTRQGLGGWMHDPMTDGLAAGSLNHNPFTPAELEPILRPYDIDTNRLPPRLAAILGSAAEESRLRITTDSWDTTAITGSAAVALFGTGTSGGWLQSVSGALYGTGPHGAVSGAIGGEVSWGEKFDLNRPLVASGTANAGYSPTSEYVVQRQAYFKDLYTLLVGLKPDADRAALAQWAANVVEFRDADSRVIPFEYDDNPQNGWEDADGNVKTAGGDRKVVWGAERPEIVIRQAFAWNNSVSGSAGLAITLHRPWNAKAYATGSTNLIEAEPCDLALDTLATSGTGGLPLNQIDLGKKAKDTVLRPGTFPAADYNDVSGATYPIWRLRLTADGATKYVRLDAGSAAADEFVIEPALTDGAGKPKMPPDSNLTLVSGTVVSLGDGGASSKATLAVTGSSVTIAKMQMPGTATSGTIYLERLSDPSGTPTSAIWSANPETGRDTATEPLRYLVVDQTEIEIVDSSQPDAPAHSRARTVKDAKTAFWKTPEPDIESLGTLANNATLNFPTEISGTNVAWFPWPNRPFVSAAELLLVPQGDAVEILEHYQKPTPAESGAVGPGKRAPLPLALLFDAVHVPTRFAGIHTTTGTAAAGDLSTHGIHSGTSQSPAATVTANQLSSWREPGRVNLNTIVAEDVWNAVVAGPLDAPVVTGTKANLGLSGTGTATVSVAPATSMFAILALSGSGATVVSDTTTTVSGSAAPMPTTVLAWDKNPLHEIYTATRLANTATPRSNLFGVWITLRESVEGHPDSVKYRRAFYIVDRSIPVGFEPGRDHNVWDCVRVRRIIE